MTVLVVLFFLSVLYFSRWTLGGATAEGHFCFTCVLHPVGTATVKNSLSCLFMIVFVLYTEVTVQRVNNKYLRKSLNLRLVRFVLKPAVIKAEEGQIQKLLKGGTRRSKRLLEEDLMGTILDLAASHIYLVKYGSVWLVSMVQETG